MKLSDHINELRKRVIWAVLALIISTIVGMAFADKYIALLATPIGGLENLISIEITESISACK